LPYSISERTGMSTCTKRLSRAARSISRAAASGCLTSTTIEARSRSSFSSHSAVCQSLQAVARAAAASGSGTLEGPKVQQRIAVSASPRSSALTSAIRGVSAG
jgi:hypothetical protein